MCPRLSPQVVHKARLQFPHSAFTYHEPEGCVVLSCFAGSHERRDGGGLPVAVTFSTYWERAVQAAEKGEVSLQLMQGTGLMLGASSSALWCPHATDARSYPNC